MMNGVPAASAEPEIGRRRRRSVKVIWRLPALSLAGAVLFLLSGSTASADPLPYRLPAPLPVRVGSPPMAPDAPYTPLVKSLIKQLEPDSPPTPAELLNADAILHGTNTSNC